MLAKARCKYVRVSPYKLRPLANVVRGQGFDEALAYLKAYSIKKVKPILKTLQSAGANARHKNEDLTSMQGLYIKEIRIDQGPVVTYFKPGAMGRASVQRKRSSHIEIVLDRK